MSNLLLKVAIVSDDFIVIGVRFRFWTQLHRKHPCLVSGQKAFMATPKVVVNTSWFGLHSKKAEK